MQTPLKTWLRRNRWVTVVCALLLVTQVATAKAPAESTKSRVEHGTASPHAPKSAGLGDVLGSVVQAGQELQALDQRLKSIDATLANLSAAIVPVGSALQPANLKQTLEVAADVFFWRAVVLILLATGCGAGLVVLWGRVASGQGT